MPTEAPQHASSYDQREISVKHTGFAFVEGGVLLAEPGRIFSANEIVRSVWDAGSRASVEDVQQYIYMLRKKLANIQASGADVLLAGDMGCLMNMAGKLKRTGSRVEVRHIAEVLAGEVMVPAIAEGEE